MKLTLVVVSVMVIALAHFGSEVNAAPKKGGKIPLGSIGGALGGAAAVVGAAGAGGNLQARSIDFDSVRVERSPKRKLSGSGVLSGAQLGADIASAAIPIPGRR